MRWKPCLALLATSVAAVGMLHATAGAQATLSTAFVGGIETGRSAVPELVVFNTSASEMTLNLVLRSPAGVSLANLPAALTGGPRQSLYRDLRADLARAGTKGRAYVGAFTAEVSGEAPFAPSTTIVHVTQYFGSRKKPRAAFVVRPVFNETSP
jgi:hypothetical protein